MKLAWEKVPSVTHGGKPYFYIARPVMSGMKRKYLVVWSRDRKQWLALVDDLQTCATPEEHGTADTYKEAQAILEADYQVYIETHPVNH